MKLAAIDISGNDPSLPFYVYLYRDTRDGKELAPLYVGKGCDTFKKRNAVRARRHWMHQSQNPILRNILSQMKSAGLLPRLEIVARFATEQEAFENECVLIAQYGRRNTGTGGLCNLTDGGEGPSGTIASPEARARMSAAQKRIKNDPEMKRRISAAMKEVHADPEFVAKRAASLRAAMATPEHKAIRSAFMKEVHARPGDKEARSASLRASLASPEARELKSMASKSWQRPENVDAKRRHSDGLKRRWADEAEQQKQSERMRALHQNPEHKAKHLAAVRAFAERRRAAKMSLGAI